ncbi:unnamed protein product [Blepharisma stoltei]|uniref:Photosystem I assembly protein Ycf3 n=1 Tax=Blepharisma stoltei TaxID=1481888 RepID=A0AAU9JZV3_9CILI|nr:unnamed protein product [Blepharisma stoltei]
MHFEFNKIDINFEKEGENLQLALSKFKEAIRIDPNHADAYNSTGLIYSNEKRHEEAIKHYNDAIRIDPNCALYYSNKGNALYEIGRREETMECYKEAIRLIQMIWCMQWHSNYFL